MTEDQQIIEHKPSIGCQSNKGMDGQTIAIVAHSHHYGSTEHEGADFTTHVVEGLRRGERDDQALVSIQRYFGASEDLSFWDKVIFFNFLPNCIGQSDAKYGRGTDLQRTLGRERFLRILFEHKVDKVLVFTKKGWSDCPETIEEMATDSEPMPLRV